VTRPLLEIAANSLGSALAAQVGGADRVELCANLSEGGTTPSPGTLAVTRDRLHIPLYVLIRPRAGDFCYDDAEVEVMLRDIETCVALGCDGVVIGALDVEGDIDVTMCRTLIAAAVPLCERVLTSGGEALALAGAERIAGFVDQAGSRLVVMAGAGINASNVLEVAERSHVRELHASARGMHASPSCHRNDRLPELRADWWESDASVVRAMADVLLIGAN
jgi:copper homeostasis protein